MNITVLIAGVHDPKWPIVSCGGAMPEVDADRQIMSPFDEAALEIALRIRDATPETSIRVFIAGGDAGAKIARAITAFNPAQVSKVHIETPWDQSAVAGTLAQICRDSDLILIGREFGDYDDGLVPPMLAAKLGVIFFSRAQMVETKDCLILMREAGSFEERCAVSGRLVVSVTNDRRTRLRKPLMKNVMLARQTEIKATEVSPLATKGLQLLRTTERTSSRVATICTMIEGTIEEQALELAHVLLDTRG